MHIDGQLRLAAPARGRLYRLQFRSGRLEQGTLRAFTVYLQSTQKMNKVPRIIGLNDVSKRRHRGAINAGHKDTVDILIGGAALEARTFREIIGPDGLVI